MNYRYNDIRVHIEQEFVCKKEYTTQFFPSAGRLPLLGSHQEPDAEQQQDREGCRGHRGEPPQPPDPRPHQQQSTGLELFFLDKTYNWKLAMTYRGGPY